ncbi:MAG: L,D-transpeptidase [Candidatus Dormibacteria bacterium]
MKRLLYVLVPVFVIAGMSTATVVRANSMSTAKHQASSLKATIMKYEANGLPAASIAQETHALAALDRDFSLAVWSPAWWTSPAPAEVITIHNEVEQKWTAAVTAARAKAESQITSLSTLTGTDAKWIPSTPAPPSSSAWVAALNTATTPKSLNALTTSWQKDVASLHSTIVTTQREATLAAQQGPSGLLGTAHRLLADAASDHLDPGSLGTLATQFQQEIQNGTDTTQTSAQLEAAEQQLQSTIALNNQVFATDRATMLLVNQAEAEGTPGAQQEATSYGALHAQYIAASTASLLQTLPALYQTLQSTVQQDLQAHVCGHTGLPQGKVITVSLTLQEMVFYDNGCVANATPVTTGMPQRPTPTGTFYVYDHQSPFHMISSDPTSSPFWYPPTWVTWVMGIYNSQVPKWEGYFIHDAYWEPITNFGPGGEYLSTASHGCVHTPHSVMQWAYSWVPNGTPVIISQ